MRGILQSSQRMTMSTLQNFQRMMMRGVLQSFPTMTTNMTRTLRNFQTMTMTSTTRTLRNSQTMMIMTRKTLQSSQKMTTMNTTRRNFQTMTARIPRNSQQGILLIFLQTGLFLSPVFMWLLTWLCVLVMQGVFQVVKLRKLCWI